MQTDWQIVAFPLILTWREEFWSLPLYFPDLKLGVLQGWPAQLPYQGLSLPPEAEAPGLGYKHYQPGELRQWQAFGDYQTQGEESDLLQAIRKYGQELPLPEKQASPQAWSLAWQLEKMQADQDDQLLLVDRGQQWLGEILAPEPWEEKARFGSVPGVEEMVDPEVARLRYLLWRRVMAPYLQNVFAPLLLGRTSPALFHALKGWPRWTELKKVQVSLPGCRTAGEWLVVRDRFADPKWQERFGALLAALLTEADISEDFKGVARELEEFMEDTVASDWPLQPLWRWQLEIWGTAPEVDEDEGPVLSWSGAKGGILPG